MNKLFDKKRESDVFKGCTIIKDETDTKNTNNNTKDAIKHLPTEEEKPKPEIETIIPELHKGCEVKVYKGVKVYTFEPQRKADLWDSELVVFEKIMVFIPRRLEQICAKIQQHVDHCEFSILATGGWSKRGYEVYDDYYIPKQESSFGSVDYKEPLDELKKVFSVVIHSHRGIGGFSKSDEDTINTHFPCSLLFCDDKFTAATVSVQVNEDIKLKLAADKLVLEEEAFHEEISGLENISKSSYAGSVADDYRDFYGYGASKHTRDIGGWKKPLWSRYHREDDEPDRPELVDGRVRRKKWRESEEEELSRRNYWGYGYNPSDY